MSDWLGRVHFTFNDNEGVATLGIDGKWTVAIEGATPEAIRTLEEDINLAYSLRDSSPADGQLGALQCNQLAEDLLGRVEFPHLKPPPKGVIY